MQCVACEGAGCDDCHGRGWESITRCPCEMVTGGVWELTSEAMDAESHFLPNTGGINDQPARWVTAWRRYRTERNQWKARMKPNG